MTFNNSCRLLAVCVLVAVIAKIAAQDYSNNNIEESIKELVARRKNVELAKKIVDDVSNELERLHKRSCFFRLPGMDCDYGDIAGDMKDQVTWGRKDSPGKRSNPCYKIGNPEGCLGKVIDENKKDESHWGNPDGPGKK